MIYLITCHFKIILIIREKNPRGPACKEIKACSKRVKASNYFVREKFRENRSVFSANREKFRAICVSFNGYVIVQRLV